jgi:hypothetical protein
MRHTVELFTREQGRVLVNVDSEGFLAAEEDAETWAERQRPRLHVIEANSLYPRSRSRHRAGEPAGSGTGPIPGPSALPDGAVRPRAGPAPDPTVGS